MKNKTMLYKILQLLFIIYIIIIDIEANSDCDKHFRYCVEDITNKNSPHIQCGTLVHINNQTFTCSCSSTSCSSVNKCDTIYQLDEECQKRYDTTANDYIVPFGIIIFLAFVCSCTRRNLTNRYEYENRYENENENENENNSHQVLEITTYTLDDIEFIDNNEIIENQECVICLDELKQNEQEEKTIAKLKCEHLFHKKCIFNWFDTKPDCPICRGSVVIDEETVEIPI